MRNIIEFCLGLAILLTSCNNHSHKYETENKYHNIKVNVQFENVVTALTDKHVNIPGSRIFIIPPDGYNVNLKQGIIKLVNDTILATISAVDYPDTPFILPDKIDLALSKSIIDTASLSFFKINGITAVAFCNRKTFLFDNTCGLMLGDKTFSAYVNYTAKDDAELNKIAAALKTIYYDKTKVLSPFENEIFSVDDAKCSYKFTQKISDTYIYTKNSFRKNTYNDDDDFVAVMLIQDNLSDINKLISEAKEQFSSNGYRVSEISKMTTVPQRNGKLKEFTITFYTPSNLKATQYYAQYEAGKDKLLIIGNCHSSFESNLKDFKDIARTAMFKTL